MKDEDRIMMNYQEFVETLMKEIEEETGLRTEFHEDDEKMSQDGIWVYISENKEGIHFLRLLTKESYCKWKQKEATFHDFVREVKQSAINFRNAGAPDKIKQLMYYDLVRERLFVRLINFERNKAELEDYFYKRIGEIAMVLYEKIADEDGCVVSCKVPLKYVDKWNLNKEDIFIAALKNTELMMPPRVYEWVKTIVNPAYEGEDIYDPDYIPAKGIASNCLSTNRKTNGAVGIFYPGVARLFCDKLDTDDIYLVFTSVHEVMIHNANGIEPEDLKLVLEDMIREEVPEEDVLTHCVYHYNVKTDRIEMLL